jgi:hypothetical protein
MQKNFFLIICKNGIRTLFNGVSLLDNSPEDFFDNFFGMFEQIKNNGFSQWFVDAYAVLKRIGLMLLIIAGLIQVLRMALAKNKAPWANDYMRLAGDILFKAFVLGGMPWLISKIIDLAVKIGEAV